MARTLMILLGVCWLAAAPALNVLAQDDAKDSAKKKDDDKDEIKLPKGVPAKVGKVLKYVDEHNNPMPGYEGGRVFGNFEKLLPQRDAKDKPIKYHEWDVNPHKPGVNRGAERLVTGSNGSAYYTDDHYKTFKKIR